MGSTGWNPFSIGYEESAVPASGSTQINQHRSFELHIALWWIYILSRSTALGSNKTRFSKRPGTESLQEVGKPFFLPRELQKGPEPCQVNQLKGREKRAAERSAFGSMAAGDSRLQISTAGRESWERVMTASVQERYSTDWKTCTCFIKIWFPSWPLFFFPRVLSNAVFLHSWITDAVQGFS